MQKNRKSPTLLFIRHHVWQLLFLVVVFFITTIPFITKYPFNWDAAQFVLGVENYAVDMHQPHPPGYPLYIGVAKVLHILVSSHTALIIETVFFALVSVLVMYLLVFRIWKQRWLAMSVALLWLVNPMFWMYRETALTYVIDSGATLLLLLFTYILFTNPRDKAARYVYYSAITLAVLGGFRPSMIVLLAPVLLVQWIYLRSKTVAGISIVLSITICLAWYIPMVIDTGGLAAYDAASETLYSEAASGSSGLYGANWSATFEQMHILLLAIISALNTIVIPIIVSCIAMLYYLFQRKAKINGWFCSAVVASVIVPLFIFGFIHIGQLGYLLVILPVAYLITAHAIFEINRLQHPRLRLCGLIFLGVVFFLHASVFLFTTPKYSDAEFFPTTRSEVWMQSLARKLPQMFLMNATMLRGSEEHLVGLIELAASYKPEEVLIITGRNISYPAPNGLPIRNNELFRELGATLPEYLVMQIASDSDKYMRMQHNKTKHVDKTELVLPQNVKYIIIALDRIPKGAEPEGLITEPFILPGGHQYYFGTMKDTFTFYQITIKHRLKP